MLPRIFPPLLLDAQEHLSGFDGLSVLLQHIAGTGDDMPPAPLFVRMHLQEIPDGSLDDKRRLAIYAEPFYLAGDERRE